MRVAIHQPEHLPWLGFFHKAAQVDCLILLDNVSFRRNYFQNRNKIKTRQGWQWITVPVRKEDQTGTDIRDVRFAVDADVWIRKNVQSIRQAYGKTPHFESAWRGLEPIYATTAPGLAAQNRRLIEWCMAALNIAAPCVWASDLVVHGSKGDLVLDICRKVGATCYLSGISGRDYLSVEAFGAAGIRIEWQEFHHPVYRQIHGDFIPCLSAIDLVFHHGPVSRAMLMGQGVPVLEKLFV